MSGPGTRIARSAITGALVGLLAACAPGRPAPSGSGHRPAAAPTVVDSGFGALPWAGVLSRGRIGTPEFYDHTAETAAARSYGRATPFDPPGFPEAFPAYPAPGVGYSGPAR